MWKDERWCAAAWRETGNGPYQVQAAINAVHSDAAARQKTDWMQILALYDQLMAVAPHPVGTLNRAVAVARLEGSEVALALVDDLAVAHDDLFHAIRADLPFSTGA